MHRVGLFDTGSSVLNSAHLIRGAAPRPIARRLCLSGAARYAEPSLVLLGLESYIARDTFQTVTVIACHVEIAAKTADRCA